MPERDLRPGHIEAVFCEFLDRRPSSQEIELWMGVGTVGAFLDGVLASDEYAARRSRRAARDNMEGGRSFLNYWSGTNAEFTHPVGTISPDGVAMVGSEGHLFLCGGSNDNLAMYRGELPLTHDWLERWRALVAERQLDASRLNCATCLLVIPDKLAVYHDLFPQDSMTSEASRPILRLLREAELPIIYPCGALCDARSQCETYLRTDSHLTAYGNRLIAGLTVEALGCPATLLDEIPREEVPYVMSGDLGQHFRPPIVEINRQLVAPSASKIVFDNWSEVSSVGGHIGIRRVFRRDDARDPRTIVVFGDSYGFGDESYQGLSWFLAQIFREVHFVWLPFGWDPDYLERVGADLVVCQTAERFVGRVPRTRVDSEALVQETMGRRAALGLTTVFGDTDVANAHMQG